MVAGKRRLLAAAACAAMVGCRLPCADALDWAVLVDASRYFINYRHSVNSLEMYHTLRSHGMPDSRIILMQAEMPANNARNPYPAQMYSEGQQMNAKRSRAPRHQRNMVPADVEVDYRGDDVTPATFLHVLTGRATKPGSGAESGVATPVLDSDEDSRLLIYMTGHGGDEFLKFHDVLELSSYDIGRAFTEMHHKRRYKEVLFVVDTCQAESLANNIVAPNIISMGSARVGENSYAMNVDMDVGVSTVDRFTLHTVDWIVENDARIRNGKLALNDYFDKITSDYMSKLINSHVTLHYSDRGARRMGNVPLKEFIGREVSIEPASQSDIAAALPPRPTGKGGLSGPALDRLEQARRSGGGAVRPSPTGGRIRLAAEPVHIAAAGPRGRGGTGEWRERPLVFLTMAIMLGVWAASMVVTSIGEGERTRRRGCEVGVSPSGHGDGHGAAKKPRIKREPAATASGSAGASRGAGGGRAKDGGRSRPGIRPVR